MLRFLRKSLPDIRQRHRFLYKTICLSAGMHCLLALVVCIVLQFSTPYTFVVRKEHTDKNTRIVLVPLARRIPDAVQKTLQHKETTKVARATKQQKKSSTTLKKQEPVKTIQKVLEKKIEQSKSKPIPKKESKITETKVVQQKTKTPTKVAANQKKVTNKQDTENVMYVGREDMKELQLYKTVSHAVQKEWQPPAGVPASSFCNISFVVGPEGAAHDVHVMESSHILVYDIAARSAVLRARFEPNARGKKCTVVFKI